MHHQLNGAFKNSGGVWVTAKLSETSTSDEGRWASLLTTTDGIVHVLRTILAEADLLMAVDGYPTLADLSRDAIRRT